MRRKSFEDMECGVARALDLIGDPWTVLIIRDIMFGTRSFLSLHNNLGIARNTLTDRLNRLVSTGILARRSDATDGRRTEYVLEESGKDLLVVLAALSQWGNRWAFGDDGPPSYVAERASDEPVAELHLTGKDGRKLGLADVEMRPGPSASAQLRRRFAKTFGQEQS